MARYIVLPTIDPRGVPSYYIVDTSDNSRVRRYDCGVWAEHEAQRMNGEGQTEKDESLLNRLYERLFHKGVQMDTNNRKTPCPPSETAKTAIPCDYIRQLITEPDNAGSKSRVLSWLLRKWEEEQNDLECENRRSSTSPKHAY